MVFDWLALTFPLTDALLPLYLIYYEKVYRRYVRALLFCCHRVE